MRILAITGHQRRAGIDWIWVENALRHEMELQARSATQLWSCLATGADTIAAEAALAQGIGLGALIPHRGYELGYDWEDRQRYDRLVDAAEIVDRIAVEKSATVHLDAGRKLVERADVLLAVWDGKPAGGPGGTADVIAYAKDRRMDVRWFDTANCTVQTLTNSFGRSPEQND